MAGDSSRFGTLDGEGPNYPLHPQELERLTSLSGLGPLDRGSDPLFTEIAQQAATLCGAPMGIVSLVREYDQVFLGNAGMEGSGTPRDEAICAYTILDSCPLVVEDIQKDPRFAHFGPVKGSPFLRFYAGAPITDHGGLPLGTVCVLDTTPHEISNSRLFTLQRLAAMAGILLETRRFVVDLMGPHAQRNSIISATGRLDRILEPLFDQTNGFRPANT